MTGAPQIIIAEISNSEDLRRVFRARAEELNLSRNTLDEIAGLPAGYCAKLLADPPVRDIGPTSLWPLLGALGLAFAAIEDEAGNGANAQGAETQSEMGLGNQLA